MTNQLKQNVLLEFKDIKSLVRLTPQTDWGLIWVLTAGEIDIKNNSQKKRNETRDRLETGIDLVKKITSLRTNNQKLTIRTIQKFGPKIYFSGYNEHNQLIKKYKLNKFFEDQYDFPSQNIIVGPLENILHTDHQFQKFPKKLISQNKKIIIVTSGYHIPRCRRYLKKYPKKYSTIQAIFYPSKPLELNQKIVDLEINKIINYTQEGILPTL